MAQEIELKLAFPVRSRKQLLNHPLILGGKRLGQAQTLINTYFDTPGLDLGNARVALRTRKAGRAWLQTVKCAAESLGGLSSRPEWEQAYSGEFDFSAVADAPRALLELHRAAIVPLFTTNFRRETFALEPSPGVRVLAMIDIGKICAAGREEDVCELELELDEGTAEDIWTLAISLARDLPLIPYDPSKAARGYRLFRGEAVRPARAHASNITLGLTPRQAFRQLAFQILHDWQANTFGALNFDSPDFVHQMRVALRRLRTLIRAFSSALPESFVAAWSEALAGLANGVGAARDLDVLMTSVLAPVLADTADEALLALQQRCEQARQEAREAARRLMLQRNSGEFLLSFARDLYALAEDRGEASLPAFAHACLRGLRKRQLARLAEIQVEPLAETLHQLRIGFKRMRYTLEFFAPLCAQKTLGSYLKQLAALQEDLGYLHDLEVAQVYFDAWSARAPQLREAAGFVRGWHAPRARELKKTVLVRAAALLESRSPWRKLNKHDRPMHGRHDGGA